MTPGSTVASVAPVTPSVTIAPLAVAAAVMAVTAGGHPVGLTAADAVFVAAFAVLVVAAASRCGAGVLLLAWAAVAGLLSGGLALGAAAVGVFAALVVAVEPRRLARWSQGLAALCGLALVVAMTRLRDVWGAHSSAIAAGVAAILLFVVAWRSLPRRPRRWVAWGTAAATAVVAIVVLFAAAGAWKARTAVSDAAHDVRLAVQAVRDGDATEARRLLQQARREVADARGWIDGAWQQPARVLPVVGQNLRSTSDVLAAVESAIGTLDRTADSASLGGLGMVNGAVDLEAVAAVAGDLDTAVQAVQQVDRVIATQRSPWLVAPLRSRLDEIGGTITDVETDLVHARDALAVAPALLGGGGERRYLVIFVTPSESRAGGFPGQAAELILRDGHISLGRQTRSDDMAAPAGTRWTLTGVDEYIDRYGVYRVQSAWPNITMSPDFPTVATVAQQIYEQATGTHVDGVLRVGPRAFAALLQLTGPIEVEGLAQPLTADMAFAFFTRGQYDGRFPDISTRIEVLDRVVETMVANLTLRRLDDPRRIGDVMGPVITAGDLAFWSPEPAEQSAMAALGMSSAVPPANVGDTLFVTQHDLLTNKIDSWSSRHIEYRLLVDSDAGTVAGSLAVTVVNDAPADGPVTLVGNEVGLPPGTMRELITIYSPQVLSSFVVNGHPTDVLLQGELGRYAYQVEVEIAPGEQVVIRADVTGPARLVDGRYTLTMPVVPAAQPDTATIVIDGVVTEHTFTRPLVVRQG